MEIIAKNSWMSNSDHENIFEYGKNRESIFSTLSTRSISIFIPSLRHIQVEEMDRSGARIDLCRMMRIESDVDSAEEIKNIINSRMENLNEMTTKITEL